MQSITSRFGKFVACGAIAVLGSAFALADISDIVFRVTATNDAGTAVYEGNINGTDGYGYGYWDAGHTTYTWQMTSDVVLSNGAVIMANNGSVASGIQLHNDPMI